MNGRVRPPTLEEWQRTPYLVRVYLFLIFAAAVFWSDLARRWIRWMLPVALACLLVSGCGVDPRNQADAERTRILAAEEAADLAQARAIRKASADLDLIEQEKLSAARIAAGSYAVQLVTVIAGVAASVCVLALSVGVAVMAVGTGRAAAHGAMVRAGLVKLERDTRQYPLVLSYVGRGCYTLSNPNTGAVLALDTRRNADSLLVRRAGAVQLAGVVAQEAARSSDPAAFAIPQEVEL